MARTSKEIAVDLMKIREIKGKLDDKDKLLSLELMGAMKSEGLNNVEGYIIATRKSLKVVKGFELDAILWAQKNFALKIDTSKALALIKRSLKKAPKFFKISESKFVTRSKKIDNNEDEI